MAPWLGQKVTCLAESSGSLPPSLTIFSTAPDHTTPDWLINIAVSDHLLSNYVNDDDHSSDNPCFSLKIKNNNVLIIMTMITMRMMMVSPFPY